MDVVNFVDVVKAVWAELSENDRYNGILRPGLDMNIKTGAGGVRGYGY